MAVWNFQRYQGRWAVKDGVGPPRNAPEFANEVGRGTLRKRRDQAPAANTPSSSEEPAGSSLFCSCCTP